MGQSDTVPGTADKQQDSGIAKDAVTTDHTIQNPAQAPGAKQPENTAGVRQSTTVTNVTNDPGTAGTGSDRETKKENTGNTGRGFAPGTPAPKEGGPESRR